MKRKSIIVILSLLAIILVSGALAYFTDTATVNNKATMGKVDIELKEYTMNETQKVEWTDVTNVLPGDIISKIPEITCVEGSADCYVRAKVTITSEDIVVADITKENLNVDTSKWYEAADGYFYYKTPLTTESEAAVLFTQVEIPLTLDNTWAEKGIDINVKVDAIQAANVTPDFTGSGEVWPGVQDDDIIEYTK